MSADAGITNYTAPWCKPKGTSDQVIVKGAFASLIFRADGDLVLEPTNHLASRIWSSGTAGTGDQVCWTIDGTLAVRDAAGATLWSKSGGTVSNLPPSGEYAYTIAVELPIRLKLYFENGQPKFTLRGDLTLESLSGELSLYAEAYVKVCWWKVSADWSKELFRWKGVEWTRALFSKTGSF